MNETSQFDPSTFLDATVSDAMDTKIVPVPAGEYPAIADKVEITPWQSRDGSKSGLKAQISWAIEDAAVAQITGRPKNLVRQDIMLDLNDNGTLDVGKGRNVTLGRLRDATGLNQPGQPFSFRMLEGKMAKVSVSHREHEGNLYAEIKAVTRP